MHTIHLQVQDTIYDKIVNSGIDIQGRFDEFIADLIDDGYPSITKSEAARRVAESMERYQNHSGEYLESEDYSVRISETVATLRAKYENHQG
jgi:hypothetical protein